MNSILSPTGLWAQYSNIATELLPELYYKKEVTIEEQVRELELLKNT